MADNEYARMAQRRREKAQRMAEWEEEKRLAAERERAAGRVKALEDVRAYLDKREMSTPLEAVTALGASGDAEAIALLREALADEQLRLHAFRALARTDDAAKALRRALAGDGEVSRELDLALGAVNAAWASVPAGDAVTMLVEALDRQSPYRLEIIRALGASADARAIEPLFAQLKSDRADIRAAAESALPRFNVPPARLLLGTIDTNAVVRHLANEMLKKCGSAWTTSEETRQCVGPLLEALCSANGQIRQNATNALRKIPVWSRAAAARATIPTLVLAAVHQPDLVYTLGIIDTEWPSSAEAAETIPSLLAMHIARNSGAMPLLATIPRWQATAQARAAIPALIATLADADAAMRRWAASTLDEIDPAWPAGSAAAESVPMFIGLLDHDDPQRRIETLEILTRIGDPRAVEPIVRRLYDKDDAVRTKAFAFLAGSGDPQVVPLLIAELEKKSAIAATLLGDIGDERAVEPLLVTLREPAMRKAAARALRKFPKASAELRAQLLPIAGQAIHLTRAAMAAGWREFLRCVDPYLVYGAIRTGYSSTSEDGYYDAQEQNYEETGYLLCARGEDKLDEQRYGGGLTSTSLIAAGKPAVFWLRSGRLFEVETTASRSHAAMSSSSRHWATRQRLFDLDAFASHERQSEALRRCCDEFLPILRELCGPDDGEFAATLRDMADAGIA